VEDNALRGGDIAKTLLKFSRPSGEFKPVTWPKILATTLEVVQHRVDLTRFDLKEQFPEGLAAVNGDHNLLADSLFNLISNAYDAMEKKAHLLEKGEVPVHPEDPIPYRGRLTLRGRPGRSEDGKDWVVLEVADNGLGMTPEELECLFIPFFTTKGSAEKGTGLGLFVIQRVIERHGGTISCQSEYGVGSTFTIRLPACASALEAPTAPQEKPNA
jgi:signal transduction histidine kinase